MMKKMLMFALLCFVSSLYAESEGEICGYVKAKNTGEPLICVNVMIEGTYLGSATDTKGFYCISKIPAGTYSVTASIIGYRSEMRNQIIVVTDQRTEVNFELVEEAVKLDKVTITATRGYNLVTDVPVSTSIITGAELQQRAAQNVGEALESTGGVFIKNYGDVSAMKTISIRGSTDSQVLVLIDGQRLNNSQNSSVDFNTIPAELIEKIEVVKGGHSALYGANAVGGIVNIITKSAVHGKKFSGDLKTSFGSQGTQIYTVNGSQELGRFGYFLTYKHLKSDGDYTYEDAAGEEIKLQNNDSKSNHLFFKANYTYEDKTHFSFSTQINRIDKGVHGTLSYPSLNRRMKENMNLYNFSFDRNVLSRLHLKANIYYNATEDIFDDPDAWDAKHSQHENNARGLELQNRFILRKNIVFTYGYDFRKDELKSTQLFKQERETNSFYLQGEYEQPLPANPFIQKLAMIPSVRYDDYSDVGNETSPKLGLVMSRLGALTASLRGNVGKSFRSPTFNDLYWPEDFWSKGNPNLKPEIGFNYDAGTILQYGGEDIGTDLELTYFVSDLKDLIIWAPINAVQWAPQNVDKTRTSGVETNLGLRLFGKLIRLDISHTYMEAKNNSDDSPDKGKYLIYRPKHKVDVGVTCQYHQLLLNLIYRYLDKSFIYSDNSASIPSYGIMNLSLGFTPKMLGLNWQAKFEMLNLSDQQYQVVYDHVMPGRQVRFTLGLGY